MIKAARGSIIVVTLLWLFVGSAAWAAGAESVPIKLVFGADTTEMPLTKFMDFSYVTPEMNLGEGNPWGWKGTTNASGWVFNNDRGCAYPVDGMVAHCITCKKGSFGIRVPNGKVAAHLWTGDQFKGIQRIRGSYRVWAGEKPVVDEKLTFKTVLTERWCLRGESDVYRKNTDRWVRQVKPILEEYDFTAEVTNGILELKLENVILSALVVIPGGNANAMKGILAAVEEERRKQFEERYPWKPQPDEPMPPVTSEQKKQGFIVFQKLIDDAVYPWSRPNQDEVTNTVKAFAARGEQEALRFGIFPLRNLKAFAPEAGDFVGPSGARIETAKCADFAVERYMEPGPISSCKGGKLDPVCDVLLDVAPTDYKPGLPRMFTLDVRVPADAAPGDYRAPVVFRSAGAEVGRMELLLRVLPWMLEPAPVPYTFQSTYAPWTDSLEEDRGKESVREAKRERVRFVAKYGFNFSYFHPQAGWGTIKGEPGNRHYTQTAEQAAEMDWWYQLVMNEGNATNWIQFHGPGGFCKVARWPLNYNLYDTCVYSLSDTDRRDFVQCIRDFDEICRKKGYPKHYWYGSGEPDNFGLIGVEKGNELAKIVKEAGGSTLCSLNGPIGNKLAPPFHDMVLANAATPITDEFIARVKSLGHQFGSHNTGDSRFAAGYQLWRLGAATKFQECILYVAYNAPYAYLPWGYRTATAYPMQDGGWRPTVRWLRYREGRDDFLYMFNLEQRLAGAKAAGLGAAPAAREAEDFLKEMHEKINVDPRQYFGAAVDAKEAGSSVSIGWSAKRFDRYRCLVAGMVTKLDETLRKQGQENKP